ncbi:hypothetical protein [Streptomyces olivaceiscleroticus]|uniref:hypothetical protein n=1 Tax=Streptomyces olivaceiscleroticus TaxID=68245 RepID=UPI0031F9A512
MAETYDPETLADWGLPMVDPHPSESPHLVSEVVLRRDPPPPPAGVNATKVMANTFELREEVEAFVDLARIDVNSHWRWWHRPLSLLPPRKRWQLTR